MLLMTDNDDNDDKCDDLIEDEEHRKDGRNV